MTESVRRIEFFPKSAGNDYGGQKAALFIFGFVLFIKTAISLGSIFNGHAAAGSADGIPLDTYGPAGAQTVLSLFGLVGIANLMICLIGIVVLVRYRSLVPFMFGIFLLYQLGRYAVLYFLPVPRTGAPPGRAINLGILALMVIGLALSMWPRAGISSGDIEEAATV